MDLTVCLGWSYGSFADLLESNSSNRFHNLFPALAVDTIKKYDIVIYDAVQNYVIDNSFGVYNTVVTTQYYVVQAAVRNYMTMGVLI